MQLDSRLAGRVDTDDVLQEVFLDAAARIRHFNNEHSGSLFVWLRLITIQTLANVHRRHFGTKMRDVRPRDVNISPQSQRDDLAGTAVAWTCNVA